ncbi:hypothetical protein Pmar_PMAR027455, partial [Perkinsus marinus ATCC 50983]
MLEGLEAEFSKLLDGSTNTPAGSDGGVLDVSSGEVDSIIKEVEVVIKTVGALEKVCKDNTTAVKLAQSLIDEKQKEIEALTASATSKVPAPEDDGADGFAVGAKSFTLYVEPGLPPDAAMKTGSDEPMVPASELAAVKKDLEETRAALHSAKAASAVTTIGGGGGGGMEAMMGMVTALMQQSNNATNTQK